MISGKNWLKDKNEFLKLYDEIIKNGEFSEKIGKKIYFIKVI